MYGGHIILHGPAAISNPSSIGSNHQMYLRDVIGLPREKMIMLFAGIAREHKGLSLLSKAMLDSRIMKKCHLVLVGNPLQREFQNIKSIAGHACTLLGVVKNEKMRDVVQAADLILVLQKNNSYAECQIPAKLLEAFANARPVLGTDVGDLPLLIQDGPLQPRGWILKDSSPNGLNKLLLETITDAITDDMALRGNAAWEYYQKHCSTAAIAKVLSIMNPLLNKNPSSSGV